MSIRLQSRGPDMKITPSYLSDEAVKDIFRIMEEAGGALIVGGAVRDSLMGRVPKDIDFATPATPDQIVKIMNEHGVRTIDIGMEYGVVGAVINNEAYEITSFRKDVDTDGRRAVTRYGTSIEDDAQRRDLTINALYLKSDGEIIDLVGGVEDAKHGRIRFVGDAETRIREDRLRALRMFRFWGKYGDKDPSVHAEAISATKKFAGDMGILSAERIGAETSALLSLPNISHIIMTMRDIGIWNDIMPGTDPDELARYLVWEEENSVPPDLITRMALSGCEDPVQTLRMTKSLREDVRKTITASDEHDQAVASFMNGAHNARRSVNIRFFRGEDVQHDHEARIVFGAKAEFPVRASDLPDLSGPALGSELKRMRAEWLQSGLSRTKEELLNRDTPEFGM